jgi:hypothetical protein
VRLQAINGSVRSEKLAAVVYEYVWCSKWWYIEEAACSGDHMHVPEKRDSAPRHTSASTPALSYKSSPSRYKCLQTQS